MRGAIANVPTRLPLIGLMPSIFQEDFVTGRFCAGLDDVMADAVAFKYIAAPLTKAQLDELIQIPERKPQPSQ